MKLENIIKSWNSLNSLFNKELSLSASFKVERLLSQLEQPVMSYERRRVEVLDKYGEKKEDGSYEIKSEFLENVTSQLNELINVEVSIDTPEIIIPLDSDLKLSAKDIRALKDFVKFE